MAELVAGKREPVASGTQAELGKDFMVISDRFYAAYAQVALVSGVKVLKAADDLEVVTRRTHLDDFHSVLRSPLPPPVDSFPRERKAVTKAMTEFLVVAGSEVGSRWRKDERRALLTPPLQPSVVRPPGPP
jgi:hypothetical protein